MLDWGMIGIERKRKSRREKQRKYKCVYMCKRKKMALVLSNAEIVES